MWFSVDIQVYVPVHIKDNSSATPCSEHFWAFPLLWEIACQELCTDNDIFPFHMRGLRFSPIFLTILVPHILEKMVGFFIFLLKLAVC